MRLGCLVLDSYDPAAVPDRPGPHLNSRIKSTIFTTLRGINLYRKLSGAAGSCTLGPSRAESRCRTVPGADGSYRGSRANNEQPSMIVLAARRGSMSRPMSAIRTWRRRGRRCDSVALAEESPGAGGCCCALRSSWRACTPWQRSSRSCNRRRTGVPGPAGSWNRPARHLPDWARAGRSRPARGLVRRPWPWIGRRAGRWFTGCSRP